MSPEEVAQVQDALRRCLAPAFRKKPAAFEAVLGHDPRAHLVVHPQDREELGEALLPMPEADEFKVFDELGQERGFVKVCAVGAPSIRLPSAPPETVVLDADEATWTEYGPDTKVTAAVLIPGGTAVKVSGPPRSYVE